MCIVGFYQRSIALQFENLSAPFNAVPRKGAQPDGGLKQVLDRHQPKVSRTVERPRQSVLQMTRGKDANDAKQNSYVQSPLLWQFRIETVIKKMDLCSLGHSANPED